MIGQQEVIAKRTLFPLSLLNSALLNYMASVDEPDEDLLGKYRATIQIVRDSFQKSEYIREGQIRAKAGV